MDSIVEYLYASTVNDTVDMSLIDKGLIKLKERWLNLLSGKDKEEN